MCSIKRCLEEIRTQSPDMLLYGVPDYQPRSNREEGDGRPDIVLYPENPTDPAILFEIKTRKKFNEMEDGLQEAYDQIKNKKYEEGVLEDGYAGVSGGLAGGISGCGRLALF